MTYAALLRYAAHAYRPILDLDFRPGAAEFVYREAAKFIAAAGDIEGPRPTGPASDFIDVAVENYPKLRDGAAGESLLPRGLWEKLMYGWPMGVYAMGAMERLVSLGAGPGQRVLELGAGVGNASCLLAPIIGDGYVRTDRRVGLMSLDLPGSRVAWDFDEPPPSSLPGDFDIAFAVNALHCARNPQATLAQVASLVKRPGVILLAEGEPYTRPGLPWALTPAFGLMRGWWDRGGFRPLRDWRWMFSRYGETGSTEWVTDDGHLLGGVAWVHVR